MLEPAGRSLLPPSPALTFSFSPAPERPALGTSFDFVRTQRVPPPRFRPLDVQAGAPLWGVRLRDRRRRVLR